MTCVERKGGREDGKWSVSETYEGMLPHTRSSLLEERATAKGRMSKRRQGSNDDSRTGIVKHSSTNSSFNGVSCELFCNLLRISNNAVCF